LQNLLIKLLDLLVLGRFLALAALLLFFLLLFDVLIFRDVLVQVHLVVLELLLRLNERLVTALLSFFELFDFLLNRVVGQLSQEHLLLLVNELSGILRSLLLRELDASLGHHHRPIDLLPVGVRVGRLLLATFIVFASRGDVTVLHSV